MATETVVPVKAVAEHAEFKASEEPKIVDQEVVSSLKSEEIATLEAPVTGSEEKTKGEEIIQPAVMEIEKVNNAPVVEVVSASKDEVATPGAPITESEEKTKEEEIIQPAVVEVEKVDNAPVSEVPAEHNGAVTETIESKPDVSCLSAPAVKDVVEGTGQSELLDVVEPAVELIEKPLDLLPPTPEPEVETKLGEVSEDSKIIEKPEIVLKEPEVLHLVFNTPEVETKLEEVSEESKIIEKPEIVVEEPESLHLVFNTVENTESAVEEPETAKQLEVSESEPEVVESQKSDVKVEKPQVSEHVEVEKIFEKLETKKNIDVELAKEDGVLITKVEEVPVACTVTSETPSVPIIEAISVTPDVSDKALGDDAQQEASVLDVVEKSTKEHALEVTEAEEGKLEENVKDEKSTVPETTTPTEELGDSNPASDVTEKPIEEDAAPRDVEVVTEEKKVESVKDDIAASFETTKETEPRVTKSEEGGATDIAEKSSEGEITSKDVEVVTEKKEEENDKKDIASLDITKDTESQSTKTEGDNDLNSAAGVFEKSSEGEKASRSFESLLKEADTIAEEKKEESIKFVTPVVETVKDAVLERKVDANEPVAEPKELELEPKEKDIAETKVDELAKVAEETLNLESTKDTDDSKTNEDRAKEEVPTKAVQKQSHSIMSKVKQSLVKVKKAITGKSPTSKAIPLDAKDDVKVME